MFYHSSAWLDFWESFEHHCTFISAVWQRNRPGFAALYGIHVAYFFDIVFLSINLSLPVFYLCYSLSYFLLTKTNKDKGRIHWNCSALPRVCLVIYVFSCLKRIPEGFFPSSTPHLSKALHFFQLEVLNQFLALPHWNLYKTKPHSPNPKSAFPFDANKTTLK